MSATSAAEKQKIMNAVSVLQKFAKTGKVGSAESMEAKKTTSKRKTISGSGKKTTKKTTGGKKTKKTTKKSKK